MSLVGPQLLAYATDHHFHHDDRCAVTVTDLGEMLANNRMDGVKCSTKVAGTQEQPTTWLTDDQRSGQEPALCAQTWTEKDVGAPNGSSQGLCGNYLYLLGNRDHMELDFYAPSPPPSDTRDTSSNSPKSSSSSEESTAMSQTSEWHHKHASVKAQRSTVRKQHSITFRNARQSLSSIGVGGNNIGDHADSSDDEKVVRFPGKNSHQRVNLASGHRPNKKAPQDPCSWSVDQVQSWLCGECRKHNISFSVQDLFRMNGKGLILIGLQGFQRRMPQGGHLVHRDLQRLLRMQHNREHQWRRPVQARANTSPAEAAAAAV